VAGPCLSLTLPQLEASFPNEKSGNGFSQFSCWPPTVIEMDRASIICFSNILFVSSSVPLNVFTWLDAGA
jgi:hypothetical protein